MHVPNASEQNEDIFNTTSCKSRRKSICSLLKCALSAMINVLVTITYIKRRGIRLCKMGCTKEYLIVWSKNFEKETSCWSYESPQKNHLKIC